MSVRTRPAAAAALWIVVSSVTIACSAPGDRVSASAPEVVLPDLSALAGSVQRQIRARHATLEALRADPDASPTALGTAFGELGMVLMAAEHYEAAAVCYDHALTFDPEAARWPYYLGQLHRIRGASATAAGYFADALDRQPGDLAARVWLGRMHLDRNRPALAEPVFAEALERAPGSAAALAGLGRAALMRGDHERAVEYLSRALATEPAATSLHYALAIAYRELGDPDRAATHLRQRGDGRATPPDPLMEAFDRVLESARAYETRGLRALAAGRLAEAEALFRRGLALAPDDPALHHRLGTVRFMRGDPEGAVARFEDALQRAPAFARAHFGLGMVSAMRGRHGEAVAHFSSAVEHQPDYVEARLGLADALRVTGRRRDALPHYREVVAIDPGFLEGWLGLAITLADLGRRQDARERLREAAVWHPDRAEIDRLLDRL